MATRSGRVTKPTTKAQQASGRAAARKTTPRAPSKKVPRGSKDRPPTSQPPPAAQQRSVIPQSARTQLTCPSSVTITPQPHIPVERTKSEGWMSSPLHISFVYNADLPTSQDTETITLNLIDYMIRPENWKPGLRYNILSAACFYFSSILTGQCTSPGQVANAIQVDPQLALQVAGVCGLYDLTVRQQVMKAMEVSAEDVERGYEILYEQRVGFKDIVGKYGKKLDELPSPTVGLDKDHAIGPVSESTMPNSLNDKGGHGVAVERIHPSTEATRRSVPLMAPTSDVSAAAAEYGYNEAPEMMTVSGEEEEEVKAEKAEEEKASEVDLDLFELDEFDRFVAENE